MAVRFLVYSRWWEYQGELTNVSEATHKQEINSEDTLELKVPTILSKGDRILWQDGTQWHEHVVSAIDQEHSSGETIRYICEQAMQADLRLAHVTKLYASGTAEFLLGKLLEPTSWQVGEVDDFGTNRIEVDVTTAYKTLLEIAGTFGCEIQPTFELDESGVTVRKINLRAQIGADRGARFEYGYGMTGVRKSVLDDDVITACYGYGKKSDDAYLMFTQNGKNYVEDLDALELWGLPDGNGGKMHSFGYYENHECEDSSQLLKETQDYLDAHSAPAVSYETDIPFAQLEGVRLGDTVQVIDKDFTPELRLEARIGALNRDLMTGETSRATFGTVVSVLPDVYARLFTGVRTAQKAATTINAGAVMESMNVVYTEGGSYVCQTADGGIITANVPLDSSGNPTDTSGEIMAMRMSNGVFYSSTSVDSDGAWIWQEVIGSSKVSASSVTLSDGTNTGTLTIKEDGLYWNDTKIG